MLQFERMGNSAEATMMAGLQRRCKRQDTPPRFSVIRCISVRLLDMLASAFLVLRSWKTAPPPMSYRTAGRGFLCSQLVFPRNAITQRSEPCSCFLSPPLIPAVRDSGYSLHASGAPAGTIVPAG